MDIKVFTAEDSNEARSLEDELRTAYGKLSEKDGKVPIEVYIYPNRDAAQEFLDKHLSPTAKFYSDLMDNKDFSFEVMGTYPPKIVAIISHMKEAGLFDSKNILSFYASHELGHLKDIDKIRKRDSIEKKYKDILFDSTGELGYETTAFDLHLESAANNRAIDYGYSDAAMETTDGILSSLELKDLDKPDIISTLVIPDIYKRIGQEPHLEKRARESANRYWEKLKDTVIDYDISSLREMIEGDTIKDHSKLIEFLANKSI